MEVVTSDEGEAVKFGGGEELVSSGAVLMRVEHDAMLAVSVQRPRSKSGVLADVLADLEMVPSLAGRCFYVIPYKDRGRTVNVSGPSIHAARNLCRAWGNCASKAVVTGEDADKVTLAGIFMDLETNVRFERPLTVSKWLLRRDGKRERLDDRRMIQAIQAGASKAERNAILAGLPDWLVQSYDNKARKLAADQDRQNLSKLVEAFLELGVARERVEQRLGHNLEVATDEELADLRGLYAAIRDHETTVEEAFPAERTEAVPEGGTESAADVISGGAAVTGGAESKAAKAKARKKAAKAEKGAPDFNESRTTEKGEK